ncbi:Cytokinin dehydrogenase 5 [Asimina triloba]
MATKLLLIFAICRLISTVGFTLDPLHLLRLTVDPADLDSASVDFGRLRSSKPLAVLRPSSVDDVVGLVRSAHCSAGWFTVAARGHGHSINGQAQAADGVVVEMNGVQGRQLSIGEGGAYVDAWGGELWIDVLSFTLERGLAPRSWTDYLYLTVGGTLSNAGISGQTFNHGPQISNVYELEVITGESAGPTTISFQPHVGPAWWIVLGGSSFDPDQKEKNDLVLRYGTSAAFYDERSRSVFGGGHAGKGEHVTCSKDQNSELFHGVLGGLGQFGIITRARIALEPAPQRDGQAERLLAFASSCKQVRWIRVLYSDFAAFTRDQEYLISLQGEPASRRFDYIEGFVIVEEGLINNWRSSFFSPRNPVKISSIGSNGSVLYCLEMTKNYDESTASTVDQEVEALLKKLEFIPVSVFTTDVKYLDFLDRVHKGELKLRSKGLWEVPHPWLNLFIPKSKIADFDAAVFKGFLGNKTSGSILIYPMNKSKWDERSSVVTPDEDIFYLVAFLSSAIDSGEEAHSLDYLSRRNEKILRYCKEAGIGAKQYLPHYKTQEEWREHFGEEGWRRFLRRKMEFDPRRILAPGQGIFHPFGSFSS